MAHRRGRSRRSQGGGKSVRPRVTDREERRRLAYRWLRRGVPRAEVARHLKVSWAAVDKWEKRRLAEGPNSWREKRHPGAVPKLTAAQKTRLKEILLRGARAYGYPTDLWTLKRLAGVIRKEFGARYSLSGVWRALRALGFSAQVPLKRALERDDRYIRRWVRTIWPEIYRHARRTGATLLFVDEAGSQTTPNVRRTWAPEGWRPQLRIKGHWEKVSIISGVRLDGELYFDLYRNDITGTEVIWFLEQLLEELPGKILIIWDNGRIHRCPEVATFAWLNRDRLELRRFPPYAPEMNPDEGIWDVLKDDRLVNYCPTSLAELERTVKREMRRLKRDPRKVRTAIRQTELPIHEWVPAEASA